MDNTKYEEPHIRDATATDVDRIHRVYHEAWLVTYPNEEIGVTKEDVMAMVPPTLTEEKRRVRQEQYKETHENELSLVAEVGGEIVGVCRAIKRDEYGELKSLYVLPSWQGKGIGTALFKKAFAWFDHQKDIIVRTTTYNTKAITFYTSCGFEDTGKRFTEERFRMQSGVVLPQLEMIIRRS